MGPFTSHGWLTNDFSCKRPVFILKITGTVENNVTQKIIRARSPIFSKTGRKSLFEIFILAKHT